MKLLKTFMSSVLCGHIFNSFEKMPRSLTDMVRKYWICKKPQNCLPKWLYQFALPSAMNASSSCSTSLSTFDIIRVPDFGHSSRWVAVSHCYFNLHFPDDIWCGTSFHMFIWHLCIFFAELFFKAFGPFFNQVVCFLIVDL